MAGERKDDPRSLHSIIEACTQFEKATRDRKVDHPRIAEALKEVDRIKRDLGTLCRRLTEDCKDTDNVPCPPDGQ